MENELLRAESGATVKAYKDYAYDKLEEIEDEVRLLLSPLDEETYATYESSLNYWQEVAKDCELELLSRIKQIFP